MIFLIILIFIILILTSICFILIYKLKNIEDLYYNDKQVFLNTKNKLSMIEYHYRNYKEGQNAFTTLRDISNTLKDLDKE